MVTTSSDGGEHWTRRSVAIGSGRADPDALRVMPLAVNNKSVVGVMVVERHADTGDGCLVVDFSASLDGGSTFLAPHRVSSSSCGISSNDERARRRFGTYGDYFGPVPTPDGRFHLMWAEMRRGASALLTTSVGINASRAR